MQIRLWAENNEGGRMLFIQLLVFCLIFFVAPLAVGLFFAEGAPVHAKGAFTWVSGQVLLWAVFQVICVPLVLLKQSFILVVWLFGGFSVFLAICGIVVAARRRNVISVNAGKMEKCSMPVMSKIFWLIFIVLLLVQLVLAVVLAYEEGDDAFYVATTTNTVDSEWMFQKQPYTGGWTTLDARHGLAPFPVWVAYLAEVTGIVPVTMSQVVLPVGLIVMTYSIYYIIGNMLLEKRRDMLPVFMIMIAVIVFFGGYSTYSAENFLLVRTAQGKAVIANVVIPFMTCLFMQMLNSLEYEKKVSHKYWLLIGLAMVAGCLCSTLGSLLTCMLVGIVGICAIVCYRKWNMLVPMALCCGCPVVCALLYFIFR